MPLSGANCRNIVPPQLERVGDSKENIQKQLLQNRLVSALLHQHIKLVGILKDNSAIK